MMPQEIICGTFYIIQLIAVKNQSLLTANKLKQFTHES
jgi:hypothetical protein